MAWRALRRSPGFTLAAVFLLAIGIGGTTIIFSVTEAVLLRPLAVPHPADLARVVEIIPGRPPYASVGWDEFQEFKARTRSFRAVFAYAEREMTLDEGAAARPVLAGILSPEYFDVLGVRTALGHLPARDGEALLSHHFWQSRFHGDPHAIGRTFKLNQHPFVITGVLPREFNGIAMESGPQIHLPIDAVKSVFQKSIPQDCGNWQIAGRLRPGLTAESGVSETAAALHAAMIAAASREAAHGGAAAFIEHEEFACNPSSTESPSCAIALVPASSRSSRVRCCCCFSPAPISPA